MTAELQKTPNQTAEQILDLAETLIQTRGYSAFSYQDISSALDITKAAIHYHFASKAELGAAVIDRYSERFAATLERIAADESKPTMKMLDFYFEPYLEFAHMADRVCLCGALAGEVLVLPPPMRRRVEKFFSKHHAWLASILQRGVDRGEFRLSAPALKTARLIFSALQGALLVERTTGETAQLKDVVAALKAQVAAPQRKKS